MAGTEIVRNANSSSDSIVSRHEHEGVELTHPRNDVAAGQATTIAQLAKALAEFDQEPPQTEEDRIVGILLKNSRILMEAGESKLAFNLLRNVLLRSPDHPEALKRMGVCLRDAGRVEEATRCFRALVKIEKSLESQVMLAESFYLSERDDVALAAYRDVLKQVVKSPSMLFEIYKNVGNIHVRAGEFDAAEEYYDKAYTIQPNSDVLLVNYGTLEIQRSNIAEAVERFRAAVDVNPQNDRAWVGLAMVHRTMGDLELAMANIERALDIRRANRTALRLIVDWAVQDAAIPKAIARLQDYVANEGSEDAEMCFVLAKLFVEAGRLQDARIELERVMALDPAQAGADQLAKVLDREIRNRSSQGSESV